MSARLDSSILPPAATTLLAPFPQLLTGTHVGSFVTSQLLVSLKRVWMSLLKSQHLLPPEVDVWREIFENLCNDLEVRGLIYQSISIWKGSPSLLIDFCRKFPDARRYGVTCSVIKFFLRLQRRPLQRCERKDLQYPNHRVSCGSRECCTDSPHQPP